MSLHEVTVRWTNRGPDFLKRQYSREHEWQFDGGLVVPASPSPSVVLAPWSNAAHVDPEEAFVASVSSCHMLWFLHVAIDVGFEVRSYEDRAVGRMAKNELGRWFVERVTLRPEIEWGGERVPSEAEVAELHERAHEQCFIANSIRTEVVVEAV